MQLITFGGVTLPTIDEDLAMPYETYSNIVALPYGAFDEHGQDSVLAPYTLTRTFKVACGENDAALNTQLDELMRVFASGRKVLQAYWRDGHKRQTFAKVINAVRPRRSNDKKYQELSVTFRIDYPYWFDTADEPPYLDHGLLLDTDWYLDGQYTTATISGAQTILTITYQGTAPTRRGYLVVRPAIGFGGWVNALTITNPANAMSFQYSGTIMDGEVLVIDFLSKSCKLNSVNMYTNIVLPADQMDWMILELGTNAIEIDVGAWSQDTTVEWHWADTFV